MCITFHKNHKHLNNQHWWDENPRQSIIGFDKKRLASWQAQRALEAQRLVGAADNPTLTATMCITFHKARLKAQRLVGHKHLNNQHWWDENPRQSIIGFDKKRFASWQAQRALEAQRLVGAADNPTLTATIA